MLFSEEFLLFQNVAHSNGINCPFYDKAQNHEREIKNNQSACFSSICINLIQKRLFSIWLFWILECFTRRRSTQWFCYLLLSLLIWSHWSITCDVCIQTAQEFPAYLEYYIVCQDFLPCMVIPPLVFFLNFIFVFQPEAFGDNF